MSGFASVYLYAIQIKADLIRTVLLFTTKTKYLTFIVWAVF